MALKYEDYKEIFENLDDDDSLNTSSDDSDEDDSESNHTNDESGSVLAEIKNQQYSEIKEQAAQVLSTLNQDEVDRVCLKCEYISKIKDEIPNNYIVGSVRLSFRFSVGCDIKIQSFADESWNVIIDASKVSIRFKKPRSVLTIWPSGKVVGHVCSLEDKDAEDVCNMVVSHLMKLGYAAVCRNFYVIDVAGHYNLQYGLSLPKMRKAYPRKVYYEPDVGPYAFVKQEKPMISITISSSGKLSLKTKCIDALKIAVVKYTPIFEKFKIKILQKRKAWPRGLSHWQIPLMGGYPEFLQLLEDMKENEENKET